MTPEPVSPHLCTGDPALGSSGALRALAGLLRQLFELIESLSDEEYARKPVGVVESSVGGHVRHNLDHVAALLHGLPIGHVCYDHRGRGTDVERDRRTALDTILRLEGALFAFAWGEIPQLITLSALVAPDLPPVLAQTSPARELAFVVSHTIHHNALVRVMVRALGADVPADFGYAPSTIAYKGSRLCAH